MPRQAHRVGSVLMGLLSREAGALAEAAARLDRAALAARAPITRALARAALAGWDGFGDGAEDDGSETIGSAPSPATPALL